MNGDLINDLVVIGYNITTMKLSVFVLAGNAGGGFDLPTSVLDLPANTHAGGTIFDLDSKDMAIGDFDLDGDNDLAITSTDDFVLLLQKDGSGNFSNPTELEVGRRPIHIKANDFNGDGFLDLATINQDSHTLHISLGNGDGTFGSETAGEDTFISIPLDSDVNLYDMVVADFDGNALPDIAFAESALEISGPVAGNGSVQIFLNPAQP